MTTERIDHVERATELGELATDSYNAGRPEAAMGQMSGAQVHATLALVEQQRIANLIALASLPETNGFEDAAYDARTAALMEGLLDSATVAAVPGYGPAGIEERVFIRPEIREGLGL